MITPGSAAPPFAVADLFARPIALSDYRGRTLLLSFFRNAACAMCNLRVHELIERFPGLHRAGLDVVAVFESPREAMLQYVGRQDAPFPLIADPAAELYGRYGLESSEAKVAATMAMPETMARVASAAAAGFALTPEPGSNFHRMPADFLIGPDGVVLAAHYARYVWDHLPFAQIEEQLGLTVSG
jgi:peroxiredoxin Q/BCP